MNKTEKFLIKLSVIVILSFMFVVSLAMLQFSAQEKEWKEKALKYDEIINSSEEGDK